MPEPLLAQGTERCGGVPDGSGSARVALSGVAAGHYVAMSQPPTSAEPKSDAPAAPDGLSAFLSKVLDQLSLSSWMPAMLLVGAAALILQLHEQTKINLAGALEALTAKPLGVLIVLLVAIVLAAVITQAFELSAIRLLEGYWPSGASRLGVTGLLVRVQSIRQRRAIDRRRRKRRSAFRVAREALLDAGEPPEVLDYWRRVIDGESTASIPQATKDAARQIKWEAFAPAHLLRAVEAAERASAAYPRPFRMMPTRLGNTLRAGEDKLQNTRGGTLRTFIIRNWDRVPSEMRVGHDQYRTRLDMYCVLVFVSGVLGIGGGSILLTGHRHVTAAVTTIAIGVAFASVCYRAAISAAEGYTGILASIDRLVITTP